MKRSTPRYCPNCDSIMDVFIALTVYPKMLRRYCVCCARCSYYGKTAFTKRGAIKLWNDEVRS